MNRFGNYELKGEKLGWTIAPEYKSLVKLQVNEDGTCTVIPINNQDETKAVIVQAITASGVQGASLL